MPSGLFRKCEECGEAVETEKIKKALWCCPLCGYHFVMPTEARIRSMLDEGTFREENLLVQPTDPLRFFDSKSYSDRLRSAQKQVGQPDAFRGGVAYIDGQKVCVGFFVYEFMGGSMGSVVGEKITRLFERARELKTAAIVFNASGGARMQEGVLSLMQMAKTTAALARLKEAGLPYLSVLLHPTTGGVAASFAMLGDVILAEPKALIGFAGPRVIEQTIRQKLPRGVSAVGVSARSRDGRHDRRAAAAQEPAGASVWIADPGAGRAAGRRPVAARARLTYAEALDRLCRLRRFGVRPGLERVNAALAALHHPERRFDVVHIAGTNGKGSTSAFAERLLRAGGRRTGLFTSPHLHRLTERIRVDGVEIPPDEIARRTPQLLDAVPEITFFEALCALAFAYFADAGVDVAVVECGLGGLLDSTNVFAAPAATVVTSIALDHTEILGPTTADIARQKAGIFRAGRPAVIGAVDAQAESALLREAARSTSARQSIGTGAILLAPSTGRRPFFVRSGRGPGTQSRFARCSRCPWSVPHQAVNAALALCAVAVGTGVTGDFSRALTETRWPGRLEWLAPDVLIDAAHNEEGARALAAAGPRLVSGRAVELVLGLVEEKDAHAILRALAPLGRRVWVTEPVSARALPAAALAALAAYPLFAEVRVVADPHAAPRRRFRGARSGRRGWRSGARRRVDLFDRRGPASMARRQERSGGGARSRSPTAPSSLSREFVSAAQRAYPLVMRRTLVAVFLLLSPIVPGPRTAHADHDGGCARRRHHQTSRRTGMTMTIVRPRPPPRSLWGASESRAAGRA